MADNWLQDSTRRAKAPLIDTTVANPARAADFLDGGRDNFEADRVAARMMMAVAPVVRIIVPAARAFHRRVVSYLVAEAGVRQFLDVGAGLATSGRTHEVAQSLDPRCRVVYVDDDRFKSGCAHTGCCSPECQAVDSHGTEYPLRVQCVTMCWKCSPGTAQNRT